MESSTPTAASEYAAGPALPAPKQPVFPEDPGQDWRAAPRPAAGSPAASEGRRDTALRAPAPLEAPGITLLCFLGA